MNQILITLAVVFVALSAVFYYATSNAPLAIGLLIAAVISVVVLVARRGGGSAG